MRPRKAQNRVILSAFMLWIAVTAMLAVGCNALHRDVEPMAGDDVGPLEDVDAIEDTNGEECIPGGVCGPCDEGEETCSATNQLQCEGAVELSSDPENCGQCGNQCSTQIADTSVSCDAGNCVVECDDPDQSFCEDEGICVDLDTDIDHCGECDNACPTDGDGVESALCDDSECTIECTDPEATFCPEVEACVDLDTDDNHCGQCGISCSPGQCCSNGFCVGGGNC